MQDDLTPRLQRSLGDAFTIERELGGGGMSRVFLATDRALDRRVVVKVLDLEGTVAASAERFRREIKLIAQLQHPHIVPVLTAGGDDTLLWYVMPYVAGESLRARLVREGALPLADALRIARELLDALAFAHDHGIVHRDVKPENILLEGRHAVVADFGVAKALSDAGVSEGGLTSIGLALGTPAYMAPEQAMADATTNHRADLYASGAVLYEMLAGAPPFSGNAQAVVAAHLTSPVPRIEERRTDVPPVVAALILRLMAKSPAERPQSAHEAIGSFDMVSTPAADATTSAARVATASAVVSEAAARRRRLRSRVIVVAVVLLAVTGGLWSLTWGRRAVVAPGSEVIAIMPIGSTGDSTLARLGADLVVTLSVSLDGVGAIRAVDPMTVLQATRALPQPLRLEDARALGGRLGAASFLFGTVVRDGGAARVELALYPVVGGDPVARISTLGQSDSIRAITDSLMRRLLAQLWRKGAVPTSILSEVATSSSDALRAFLAGENAFERDLMDSALVHYARAVELDSAFAQALLRLDYSRGLVLLPVDSVVRRRLLQVQDRLPKREREWLAMRFTARPILERLDSGRALSARYPESYAIQYLTMDVIVHTGPRYGVPIAAALPMLERLAALAPNATDIDWHRAMVAIGMRDWAGYAEAAQRAARFESGGARARADLHDATRRAITEGRSDRVDFDALARSFASSVPTTLRLNAEFAWYPGFGWLREMFASPAVSDRLRAAIDRTAAATEYARPLAFSRAATQIARGDVRQGLLASESFAAAGVPEGVRTSAARGAATAAWFGLISVAAADSVFERVRPSLDSLSPTGRTDVAWADGALAIVGADSARLNRVIASTTDTTAASRNLVRGLRALWRERRTGAIDSLLAFEEDGIRSRGTSLVSMPVYRAALGRALLREGKPADAERLLMWPDAAANTVRAAQITFQFGGYTSYERGLAAEAMGDRANAIRHLSQFVIMIDRPPPAMQSTIDDAKARLKRLTALDR